MVNKGGFILLCLLLVSLVEKILSSMDEATCLSRGFDSSILKCSTCQEMLQFKLEEVAADCMQCCRNVEEKKKFGKFSRAILEICK